MLSNKLSYPIEIIADGLEALGDWIARRKDPRAGRMLIISNPKVASLYGARTEESLRGAGFLTSTWEMRDGERFKSLGSLQKALAAMSAAGLTRGDAVVALGGGVVGDLAGFAAAVYLRGIRFYQVPTTLLAMVDSSVGGKTGVNAAFGKNVIGAFHDPAGVFIDVSVLKTLATREMNAGFFEMVKHGALSGPRLLRETSRFLLSDRSDHTALSKLVAANIDLKARVVARDPFENTGRVDRNSRKILNFGHTLAHALEKVTNYRYFLHGEAVGYGILFAAQLSKKLASLSEKDISLLYDVVHSVGTLPTLNGIDLEKVLAAFRYDKKNIAGSLQFVLLEAIGKPVILDGKFITEKAAYSALEDLFALHS